MKDRIFACACIVLSVATFDGNRPIAIAAYSVMLLSLLKPDCMLKTLHLWAIRRMERHLRRLVTESLARGVPRTQNEIDTLADMLTMLTRMERTRRRLEKRST